MKQANLIRGPSTNHGTFGHMHVDGRTWHSLELPWRDNQSNMSCIPCGEYECRIVQSPRFGRAYHVTSVPGRSHVLIHSANYAGDTSLGFKTHLHGCIALGMARGRFGEQNVILSSKTAITQFMQHMGMEPFMLRIKE